ncbi:hypothetical protein NKG60_31505 [Mesorhizobium sp. M1428]|uniref:hypothetical protein n=1 Tax=unclassified Mesorhizobium TaxID=325217 RepID=UPI00333BFC43
MPPRVETFARLGTLLERRVELRFHHTGNNLQQTIIAVTKNVMETAKAGASSQRAWLANVERRGRGEG